MSRAHAYRWDPHPEEAPPYGPGYRAGPSSRSPEREGAAEGARLSPLRDPGRRDWSAALDAVARAAHQHHARKENLRELETRVHDRLSRLEAELVHAEGRAQAAEQRAADAERRAAEAEEWLQRMYERISEHFSLAE